MPQLDSTTFSSQLFWLVMCFLVLYFILSTIAIPKITKVLDNRETLREKKIALANAYREEAEGLLEDYEKILAQARISAQQEYQFVINEANAELMQKKKEMFNKFQERLHIAEQDLYRARLAVSAEMQSVTQEVASEILQKLTGHTYSLDQFIVTRDRK